MCWADRGILTSKLSVCIIFTRYFAHILDSVHGAEFKDEPLVDRDPRSHEYLPQEGACLMCDQDVAEGDWYADIAFCKLCAKTAGPPEPLK